VAGVTTYSGGPALEIIAMTPGAVRETGLQKTLTVEFRTVRSKEALDRMSAQSGVAGFTGYTARAPVKVAAVANGAEAQAAAAGSQSMKALA